MAQLIEPDGTEGIIVTVEYAIRFCAEHPGWSWRQRILEQLMNEIMSR